MIWIHPGFWHVSPSIARIQGGRNGFEKYNANGQMVMTHDIKIDAIITVMLQVYTDVYVLQFIYMRPFHLRLSCSKCRERQELQKKPSRRLGGTGYHRWP